MNLSRINNEILSSNTDSIWVGTGNIPEAPNAGVGEHEDMLNYYKKLKKNGFKKLEPVVIAFGGEL